MTMAMVPVDTLVSDMWTDGKIQAKMNFWWLAPQTESAAKCAFAKTRPDRARQLEQPAASLGIFSG